MFNPDFYPTPQEVAAEMLDPLDLRGKTVLPEQHRRPKRRTKRQGVAA